MFPYEVLLFTLPDTSEVPTLGDPPFLCRWYHEISFKTREQSYSKSLLRWVFLYVVLGKKVGDRNKVEVVRERRKVLSFVGEERP